MESSGKINVLYKPVTSLTAGPRIVNETACITHVDTAQFFVTALFLVEPNENTEFIC